MEITEKIAGRLNEQDIKEYHIVNASGMSVRIINYGAIVSELIVADRHGKFANVVLGFDDPAAYWNEPYISNCFYLGAIVGRYGNRIAGGKFSVEGKEYSLATNNGFNHLHGGVKGFDKVVWKSEGFVNQLGAGVLMVYLSKDGEEGYPGDFQIKVRYTLTESNELRIDYEGNINKACPVNLTHHGYFNLTGVKSDILDHEVQIKADRYTVVNDKLIPTGEMRLVKDTPLDFLDFHTIGERINLLEEGYDHNYVLSEDNTELRQVVKVIEPSSGRVMDVLTTEPGIQFYSGNFLDGTLSGRRGISIKKHWGFCFEAQHFPDSPNQPGFPNTVLLAGEPYRQTTIYSFGIKK